MANSKANKGRSTAKNTKAKSKTLETQKIQLPAKKTTTNKTTSSKKSTTTKKVTPKKSPSTSKPKTTKTTVKVTNTSKGPKKTIKKEVVSSNTMEIKKVDLPKKKTAKEKVEVKEEVKEVPKETLSIPKEEKKGSKKKIVSIEKKKKRKSNSKKISKKKKKQSFSKEIEKLIRKIRIYGISSVIPVRSIVVVLIMLVIIVLGMGMLLEFVTGGTHLDLQEIPYEIDQIKTISYNIDETDEIVEDSKAFDSLKDYYTFDFEKEFKLDESYVTKYAIKINENKKQAFIAIKPSDEHDQDVKNIFEDYLKEKKIDYEYFPYQDYQFFIASSNNKVVISKIRQSQIRVFEPLKEIRKTELEEEYGISANLYTEALAKKAVILSENTGYYIFNATSRKHAKQIDKLMDKYFSNLEKELKDKDDAEYELVKNRYHKVTGNTCIYIISHDNELVKELLKI